MKKFRYGAISRNRDVIYAVSILWVMFFHASVRLDGKLLLPLRILKEYGNFGVDIFLLLSGISLYFSMVKGVTKKEFYLRRAKRILPSALITAVPWNIAVCTAHGGGIRRFVMDTSGLSLFTNGTRTGLGWFTTAILLCYLIYPFVFAYFNRFGWKKRSLAALLAAVFLLNGAIRLSSESFFANTEILFRRLPIFLIGAYLGKAVYEDRESRFTVWQMAGGAVLFAAAYWLLQKIGVDQYIPNRYPGIPLAVLCVPVLTYLGEWKPVRRVSAFLAPFTFEIFLLHQRLMVLIGRYSGIRNKLAVNLTAAAAAVIAAYFLRKLVLFLFDGKKRKKNAE